MGRIIYCKNSHMLVASNKRLIESNDGGQTWDTVSDLANRGLADIIFGGRLGSRLRRTGFHHIVPLVQERGHRKRYCIFANNSIYELDESNDISWQASINGGRPLFVCGSNEKVFYGEYRNNSERSPISVWAANTKDLKKWSAVYTFNDIRHIHGIFVDPIDDSIWVTTGDLDNESALWKTEDQFQTVKRIIGGSQQCRAVQLLFDRKNVFFASDAPNEHNYIYKMSRSGSDVKRVTGVGGPVFFGTTVNNTHFFSTVVEPSEINTSGYVELWRSDSGTDGEIESTGNVTDDWYKFIQLKKDLLPMKLFQYGQIRFPNGPGDNENLYFTPRSTAYDDKSFRINVNYTRGKTINPKELTAYKLL